MPSLRCIFSIIDVPQESQDALLREVVAPLAEELRSQPGLDSLFFARFNEPTWQIRFRVYGEPEWMEGVVRPLLEKRLTPLSENGKIQGIEFGVYRREIDRYGGEEGMRLTERISHHDSLAALDLLDVDARGGLARSRREVTLLTAERTADLLRFDREQRLSFYERGYRWVVEAGLWQPEDFRKLDERYESLKAGLVDLLSGEASRDEEARWGGAGPARIAKAWAETTGPVFAEVLEAHAAGRIHQDLIELAWSWAHLHTNRLGVVSISEAVLRYLMRRLYLDAAPPAI
jgi:thiopeptide-type bacteriocin biosynthesis protein